MRHRVWVEARCRSAYRQQKPLATIVAAIWTVWSICAACRERARCRRLVAQMSARELADIGISRSEIGFEVEKPFWRG